jgi:1-pyrroline-5-carboxylate dehydrogenase
MTGKPMISIPNTSLLEIEPFIQSLQSVPKHGVHNPFKNKERYIMLGAVCRKAAEVLHDPEVFDFFVDLCMRSVPKSRAQTEGEIRVTRAFYENFSGDNVRFLAEAKRTPGDHMGQFATGYRWPLGPVGVITPFNFPIEICVLQFMGALFMGNKPVVKPDTRASFPVEQWIRMLHYCGLPKEDMDFLHCDGPVMENILKKGGANLTLFTGSSKVGEHLMKKLDGKVKLEDGGYDWKILGPDVPKDQKEIDYVAWQCDHDAYGHSG